MRERLAGEGEAAAIAKLDVEAALTTLTPSQQRGVRLWLQGYTVREMAAALSLSPSTIQEHLTAAMRKLKKYFQEPP